MSASYITQCPHCQTSFRVTREQLAAARGKVRCGACMQVFDASHSLSAPPAQPPAQTQPQVPLPTAKTLIEPAFTEPKSEPKTAPKATAPNKPGAPGTLWIHDDLDLDSIDLDLELSHLEEQEQQLSREFQLLASRTHQEPEPAAAHDESWAQRLLDEDKPSAAPLGARPKPVSTDEPTKVALPLAQVKRIEPEFDEALNEPDEETEDGLNPAFVRALSDDSLKTESATDSLSAVDDQDDDLEPPLSPTAARFSERSEPSLRHDGLFDLQDDPLRLDWRRAKRPWGRWIGWGLLNVLAAGFLLGQYSHYHFDELARQERFRPWFEQLCPEIGCTLPSRVDVNKITSSNLVVRSHPQYLNALLVDAILYNRAEFSQPFPLIELRFADLSGKLLASRRFKPSEYLAGELAGQQQMPPQTPIHIALEIRDPGKQAVNYSLHFYSPE